MDEIKATYGENAELKIILKNANGDSRTITLADPKSDTALTTATAAFAELVLNTETNVFMVNGENPVSMVADLVTTDRTNIGEYGQTEVEPALIVANSTIYQNDSKIIAIQGYVADRNYEIEELSGVLGVTVTINGKNITITTTTPQVNTTGYYGLSDGTRNCWFTISIID